MPSVVAAVTGVVVSASGARIVVGLVAAGAGMVVVPAGPGVVVSIDLVIIG